MHNSVPEILKDYVERGLPSRRTVSWGHPNFKPAFWPEDIMPWSTVSNIAHPQKCPPPGGLRMVDVTKG